MRDAAARAGTAAAALWLLLCVRWFDAAAAWRPAALSAVPPILLLLAFVGALVLWLRGRRALLRGAPLGTAAIGLAVVLGIAFFFRLPVVAGGAAAAVTADGALSGIVALHVLDGSERLVFVPQVPYSGSLKSHVTALLAVALDPARAFALVSVLFYLAHVAGVVRLTLLVSSAHAATAAGLYAALSPAFVTRYSLSNDGNYVEVLALGTWALWLGARAVVERDAGGRLAFAAGLLLGLGFWCHILAVIHLAALALLFVAALRLAALVPLASLGTGAAVGYVPGWLWNLANGWGSLRYLVPGQARSAGHEAAGGLSAGLAEQAWLMLTDHAPVLLGYDTGYGPLVDRALFAVAWLGVAAAALAFVRGAGRAVRERSWPLAALVLFVVVNLAIALVALPHVPGNPRYLLFLMSALPVLLADAALGSRAPALRAAAVAALGVLIASGALASFAQVPPTLVQDARWRSFVSELEREGIRHCYTDFFLATRVNFLSSERIVCTAKLGPFTTEYFFAYREAVEQAPEAALVPVNRTAAGRIERRLAELGIAYERRDLLKPVLFRLSRKVDPEELFPGRSFPMR
jgi:hypothetical protein